MEPKTEKVETIPIWFMTIITFAVIVAALWFGRGYLVPLAITGLLFILSAALVDRFKQISFLGRPLPGWLAHLLSASTVIGAMLLFAIIASSSAEEVTEALPRYQERFGELVVKVEASVGQRTMEAVQSAVAEIDVGSWASAFAAEFAGALSTVGLVALYLAFLIAERSAWIDKLPLLADTKSGTQRALRVTKRIADGVKQYMWVNAVTSAMSGVVAFLIFSWIDLDFASLLALIVFAAGFIPNIGAFIAITLPSLVALIQFDDLTPFFVVLFGYGLADQFIANVIQPAMQGRSLNLSTFMVMVSLTFWATVWGGIGAFLAVPMMVVAMVVCAEIPAVRWISVLLSGDGLLEDTDPDTAVSVPTDQDLQDDGKSNLRPKKLTFEEEVAQLRAEFESDEK